MTTFTDEQLIKFKRAGFSAEEVSLFSHKPEYAPTEDELNSLLTANECADALKQLPEDLDKFFDDINKTYGVLFRANVPEKQFEESVQMLAKQNPELAKQVANLALLIDFAETEGID